MFIEVNQFAALAMGDRAAAIDLAGRDMLDDQIANPRQPRVDRVQPVILIRKVRGEHE